MIYPVFCRKEFVMPSFRPLQNLALGRFLGVPMAGSSSPSAVTEK